MIQDALDALASQITTKLGISAYSYLPNAIALKPAAVMTVENVLYARASVNALTELEVSVWLVLSRSDEKTAQALANDYAAPSGSNSLKAAVEDDRQLNGKAQDCVVRAVRDFTYAEVGNDSVLILPFELTIYL